MINSNFYIALIIFVVLLVLKYLISFNIKRFINTNRLILIQYLNLLSIPTQFGIVNKRKLRFAFIKANNAIIEKVDAIDRNELVVLLPHCLQRTSCSIRITNSIDNCKECGNCIIGDIKKVASKYNVKSFVVTGGTLARSIVSELKPKLLIAVACEKDLVEGIKEVYPFRVYGIINLRPEGPCRNTLIDIDEFQKSLNRLIK